ncbi:MAG: hypothetical protein HQL53_06595 [Magnetococcales bacterium]|nr:hypothetical protein [Magnetococcales bacterium]
MVTFPESGVTHEAPITKGPPQLLRTPLTMWILIGCSIALTIFYIILNKKKHADPSNRICAIEICELMVEHPHPTDEQILEILLKHDKTAEHARQVSSLVGEILSDAGGGMRPSVAAGRRVREVGNTIPSQTQDQEPPTNEEQR